MTKLVIRDVRIGLDPRLDRDILHPRIVLESGAGRIDSYFKQLSA